MLSTVLYYELAMKVPIPVGITVYLLTWGLGHLRCLVLCVRSVQTLEENGKGEQDKGEEQEQEEDEMRRRRRKVGWEKEEEGRMRKSRRRRSRSRGRSESKKGWWKDDKCFPT